MTPSSSKCREAYLEMSMVRLKKVSGSSKLQSVGGGGGGGGG